MNNDQLIDELINLGFDDKYVKQVPQSATLDEAINLILALQEAENKPSFNQNPKPA